MSTRNLTWRQVETGACGFCGHRHALEIEYRCVGCDRGVCALCLVMVLETREGFCPECAPASAAAGGAAARRPDDEDASGDRGEDG